MGRFNNLQYIISAILPANFISEFYKLSGWIVQFTISINEHILTRPLLDGGNIGNDVGFTRIFGCDFISENCASK